MKEILFNSGTAYNKGGDKMNVVEINSIDVKNTEKNKLPWLQVFNSGYRVTTDNIDWKTWNGCVFADVDTKRYYNNIKQFDPQKLLDALYNELLFNYYNNFYIIQISNSGTSYHVVFYFNVEKNEKNFRKCAAYVQDIIRAAFKAIGAEKIILYDKVLDKCSVSPYQGMYLTNNEILFGSINDNSFGYFENIDEYEIQSKKILEKSDVKEDGTKLFKLEKIEKNEKKVSYKEHHQRWAIYDALIAVFNDKETVNKHWEYICSKLEVGEHSMNFFLKEPERNHWYERYKPGEYIKVNKLEEFGYSFKKLFEPSVTELYIPDIIYELTEDQKLSDIDIKWNKNKINHLYAGCGLGKTFMSKELGKEKDIIELLLNYEELFGKGVCFISPMKSINRDSFKNIKNWTIIDSDNKEDNIDKYGSVKDAIRKGQNICTTWESFVLYEMYKLEFNFVIVDEIHTLYMYDYRIKSITELKKYLQAANGIKIIMTGTPSNEVNEFDCYKIEVKKEVQKVNCELLFYNKQYNGYILKDIKEWTRKDENNYAIIFEDRTNFKTQEKLKSYGIDCDIFNQNYVETVNYIIENQNVKEQITAFSVYGQAGINLWVDNNKKFRVYILSNNALGIIQYANRIRNKECIDKIIIPYKIEKINNDINALELDIDYEEAERKINVLNSTHKKFDLFNIKTKSIIELKYGLNIDCLDLMDNDFLLNKERYKTYKLIKNVEEYEKQIQIIYNRLINNSFNVSLKYMDNDVKTNKATKMRSNQFAGQMNNFNYEMIEQKGEHLKLHPTNEFKKICTGTFVEDIEYILDKLYLKNKFNFEETKEEFALMLHNLIKNKDTIKKVDIKRICNMMHLSTHWNEYYNNAFITAMLNKEWDDAKLTAAYVRSIYNDNLLDGDIKELVKEAYDNIKNLRKVVDEYSDIFIGLSDKTSSMNIQNDEITSKIYTYILSQHKKQKVVINGVEYTSVKDAMTKLGKSKVWVSRHKD